MLSAQMLSWDRSPSLSLERASHRLSSRFSGLRIQAGMWTARPWSPACRRHTRDFSASRITSRFLLASLCIYLIGSIFLENSNTIKGKKMCNLNGIVYGFHWDTFKETRTGSHHHVLRPVTEYLSGYL